MVPEVLIVLAGLAYTVAVVRYASSLAALLGVIDQPGAQQHKGHAKPTPLVGGIATLIPAIFALFFTIKLKGLAGPDAWAVLWMGVAVLLSTTVGFFDDRKHIPAAIRLTICGLIFSVTLLFHGRFVVQAVTFESIAFQFDFGWFAILFSTLCLLAFQNSVNMADGRNGLVIGLNIIWCVTLLAHGPHPSNLALVSLLIGLMIIFFANNRGMLFLGDAGTYGLGAMIGLTTIWIQKSGLGLLTVQVIAMFIIPILDMGRLFFFRTLKGKSPFAGDHNHLHHYLDRAVGWPIGRAVYFMLVIIPIVISHLGDNWGLAASGVAILLYSLVVFCANRPLFRMMWVNVFERVRG